MAAGDNWLYKSSLLETVQKLIEVGWFDLLPGSF